MKGIPLNAEVEAGDGYAGKSTNVIFNPVSNELTHFVVAHKHGDETTERTVDWGPVNEAMTPEHYRALRTDVVDYLNGLGMERLAAPEDDVLRYAHERAREVEGLRIYGEAENKAGVLSFLIDGIHPNDLGMLIDQEGVAVRTGHHCAMPVMDHYGIGGTARASFAFYNTRADVDRLIDGIASVRKLLE